MSVPGITLTEGAARNYIMKQEPYQNALKEYNENKKLVVNRADEYVDYYSDLYNNQLKNIAASEGEAKYDLGTSFNEGLSQIVANALSSKENLMSANVIGGQRKAGLSDLEKSVEQAYSKNFTDYMSQRQSIKNDINSDRATAFSDYVGNMQSIEENKQNSLNSLETILNQSQEALLGEGKQMSDLVGSVMDYFDYYMNSEDVDLEKLYYEEFTNNFTGETRTKGDKILGQFIKEEDGEYKPKSRSELDALLYERDSNTGEIIGYTQAGIDFYKNFLYGLDYDAWLYENNRELWEWANTISSMKNYKNKSGQYTNFANTFGSIGLGELVANDGVILPTKSFNPANVQPNPYFNKMLDAIDASGMFPEYTLRRGLAEGEDYLPGTDFKIKTFPKVN